MKDHLKRFHNLAAKHHHKLAKIHSELASEALGTRQDLPRDHALRKLAGMLADCHEKIAGAHAEHSDVHFRMCKALGESAHSVKDLPEIDVEELAELGEGADQGPSLARMYKVLSSD